jgi:hypothetical protein
MRGRAGKGVTFCGLHHPTRVKPSMGHSGTVTFLSEEDLFEILLNPDNDKF